MDCKLFERLQLWIPEPGEVAGPYGIPIIRAQALPYVDEWRPFNDLSKPFDKNMGVSMYVDDYRIHRLWASPDRYVPILAKAGVALSPDFSIYTDMPVALGIYNHYRKHWLAAYWQKHRDTVIPTICWGDEDSFAWCFDGEPTGCVVSVSSVGTQRRADTKAAFVRGYDAMMERLKPEAVLFFGIIPKECRGNICPVEAFYKTVERRCKRE